LFTVFQYLFFPYYKFLKCFFYLIFVTINVKFIFIRLQKAPSSLLEALEGHLASLEGRKPGSAATTPTGAAGR
jgi:hypothetical protein